MSCNVPWKPVSTELGTGKEKTVLNKWVKIMKCRCLEKGLCAFWETDVEQLPRENKVTADITWLYGRHDHRWEYVGTHTLKTLLESMDIYKAYLLRTFPWKLDVIVYMNSKHQQNAIYSCTVMPQNTQD